MRQRLTGLAGRFGRSTRSTSAFDEFRSLVDQRRLEEAVRIGEVILRRSPGDQRVRRTLANCHARLGRHERADEILRGGLSERFLEGLAEPLAVVGRAIDPNAIAGAPEWMLLPKGVSNVCVVDHGLRDKGGFEYVTKVLRGTRRHKEVAFYESVRDWAPGIARIAPRMLMCQELPSLGVTLLSIEKVRGRLANHGDLSLAADTSEVLSTHDLPPVLTPSPLARFVRDAMRRQEAWHRSRRIPLRETFSYVHQRSVNTRILERLEVACRAQRWPSVALRVLQRLRRAVIGGGLHRQVVPKRDYGFVHGDFQTANLILDEDDGRLRVLDWESYRFGPPAIDIAKFAGVGVPFSRIDSESRRRPCSDARAAMRISLLTYALLVSWLVTLGPKASDEVNRTHFSPALDRLESLSASGWLRSS